MLNQIKIVTDKGFLTGESQTYQWLQFFDPQKALDDYRNSLEILGSSRTKERHTYRAYLSSLADFCRFCGAYVKRISREDYKFDFRTMSFPSLSMLKAYIVHSFKLKREGSTICRYLAAIRKWLYVLKQQEVRISSGADFTWMWNACHQLQLAIEIKNVSQERISDLAPLDQTGTRLTLEQVHILFDYFTQEMSSLQGKRDVALLHVGIDSALRVSELARMTLGDFRRGSNCWEIRVRGKRNKYDPVEISDLSYQLIQTYIKAWNRQMWSRDPRRINEDTPIFQPLRSDGSIAKNKSPMGGEMFEVHKGMSTHAILYLVKRRTFQALGFSIGAHDMRRTCASLMRHHKFEWEEIQRKLRHKSLEVSRRYVGNEQVSGATLLTNKITLGTFELLK